jgi:hypothetical protein
MEVNEKAPADPSSRLEKESKKKRSCHDTDQTGKNDRENDKREQKKEEVHTKRAGGGRKRCIKASRAKALFYSPPPRGSDSEISFHPIKQTC